MLATWGQHNSTNGGKQPDLGLGQTVQLWDIATGKERRRIKAETAGGRVTSVVFAPDGKTLAVAAGTSTFFLFDPQTGQELRQFAGQRGTNAHLQFSPDGRLLVVGDLDFGVQAWDIGTGKRLALANGPDAEALSFGFPGKDRIIALGIQGQTLLWWDAVTGKTSRPIPGHYMAVASLAFTADGRALQQRQC